MFTFYSNILKALVRNCLEDLNQVLIRPEKRYFLNCLQRRKEVTFKHAHRYTCVNVKYILSKEYTCLQLYQLLFLFLVQIIKKCGKRKTGPSHE